MVDGWGPVVKAVNAFLEQNPKFQRIGDKLWMHVTSRLAPRSEDALTMEREPLDGLTEEEALTRHLNIAAPQSEAHYRTMMGGVGEVIVEFREKYRPTLELVEEAEATPPVEPRLVEMEFHPTEPIADTTAPAEPTFPEPLSRKKRR